MADISMCKGIFHGEESDEVIQCHRKEQCYRYTAPVNPDWQSYNPLGKVVDGKVECDEFWNNEGRKRNENRKS